jgi:uncharacterized caspase-like protein
MAEQGSTPKMKSPVIFTSCVRTSTRRDVLRKLLMLSGAATCLPGLPWPTFAQNTETPVLGMMTRNRRALVLGNTTYTPEQQALPSSRKNATDMAEALTGLGFQVHREVDQGAEPMRAMVQRFFSDARVDSSGPPLALFYYTGHGMQHHGKNYIVPSDVSLQQSVEGIAKASVNVDDDLIRHASFTEGAGVFVFDACRNDPSRGPDDKEGSFNQVNPPRGTLIVYSTAPGKFAIAPKARDAHSIYTAILLEELAKNPAMTLKDFFDSVKFRVKKFMETHPDDFLRQHVQDPEVAANLPVRMSLALAPSGPSEPNEAQEAWARIDRTAAPAERAKLLQDYVEQFKESRMLPSAQVQLERASEAAKRKTYARPESIGDAEFQAEQAKARDGDKYAAYRIAQMFQKGSNGLPRDEAKSIQWLRDASELRNGIASYELSRYYANQDRVREAVVYANRAREQGYEPPPGLAVVR